MLKLTDTQLVILSAAASRKDGSLFPLPKSLKANKDALAAVLKSLLKQGIVSERAAARDEESWRQQDDQRFALIITEAGLKALEGGRDNSSAPKASPAKAPKKIAKAKTEVHGKKGKTARREKSTKQDLLIDLLNRKTGATIKEAIKATGWQAHSVRGVISGTLKKKLGLKVASDTVEGRGRVYRIVAGR